MLSVHFMLTCFCSRSQDIIFLQDYPQYFTLSPPGLHNMVVFNATDVVQFFDGIESTEGFQMSFQCGFRNNSNNRQLLNPLDLEVNIQSGKKTMIFSITCSSLHIVHTFCL